MRGSDGAVGSDGEDLDAAVHVAEVRPSTVGRDHEAGETHLPLAVGIEEVGGRRLRLGLSLFLVGQVHALPDLPGGRVQHEHLAGLAGDEERAPVGRERQRLRPQARQLDDAPERGHDLVDRCD
jgi:hypothetical protein